ncbi:unnamed protein product [Brassicogethes aeneus]|uniref:TBC1 domain family member 15 n=1 Tax=Brassicogethes aeneus TaxID=1431903 RepID=A0A9P0FLY6_BRAAE|nr:unnamed protein product [Brassicogethes aeneus]
MGDIEEVFDLFTQDGVILKQAQASYMQFLNSLGTVYINEAKTDPRERFLEWKPNDITVDSDMQDQEWAVVNTIQKRTRTISGSLPSDYSNRLRSLRVPFRDIKSFKSSHKNRELTVYNGQGDTICIFLFQTNCDHMAGHLKKFMKVVPSKRDRNLYYVQDNTLEIQQLTKSFAELNLPTDDSGIWRLVRNFQTQPVETTFEAFSKVTTLMYKTMDKKEISDHDREALNKSITEYGSNNTTDFAGNSNDYEVVATVPELPVRPEFPRLKPLSQELWRDHMDFEGKIEDVESVKNLIFRGGICPSIRKEVWKYLLEYYPWTSTYKERQNLAENLKDEYYKMKLQWKTITKTQEDNFSDYRDRKSLIEKDVNRTDRTVEFFAGDNNKNLNTLFEILMTFVMYNFDLGYVQGMSDLLSPILQLVEDEVESFWCFVGFMKIMSSNFDIDQAGMKEQFKKLQELLAFFSPNLSNYLNEHDSANMFFCFRWLLVWFKRELSQDDVMRFWEVLWTGLPCQNFHLLIAVTILDNEKEALMANGNGFTEILKHINDLSGKLDIDTIFNKAEGVYHQLKNAEHLTDNVRAILGLPLAPSSSNSASSSIAREMSLASDACASNGSAPRCSVENVRISPDENSYERSISGSYL